MNRDGQQRIDETFAQLRTSSIASVVLVVIGAVCVVGGVFYSATRLTPLETEISSLNDALLAKKSKLSQIEGLLNERGASLKEANRALHEMNLQLESSRKELDELLSSLTLLQEGSRFLNNRQYSNAIDSFTSFLERFPDNAQALNFAGYSELRYAQFWRENVNSSRAGVTDEQKREWVQDVKRYFLLSEAHLQRAESLTADNPWPTYNLALLYYQNSDKDLALSKLSEMLSGHPKMTKWLCEDGQFRKMKIDRATAERFTTIVQRAVDEAGGSSCWVIKPVKR
jgi:tetratricopeptide (TPR) repeat protein